VILPVCHEWQTSGYHSSTSTERSRPDAFVQAGPEFKHCLVVRPRGGADSKPFTFHTTREGFDLAADKILALSGGASPSEILIGIEFAGVYGFTFAYYLQQRRLQVVSVLASHSKRWKDNAQPVHQDGREGRGDGIFRRCRCLCLEVYPSCLSVS
jgi:hypothetical protein